jgi:hypothetical protein
VSNEKKTWRNLRDESRRPVGTYVNEEFRPDDVPIIAGALCRVADAQERIARSLEQISRHQEDLSQLKNRVAALRTAVRVLKKGRE